MFPSVAEMKILAVLQGHDAAGMYGLQIVTAAGGEVKRGGVYSLLDRLTTKGFVEVLEPGPRPCYRLTPSGRHAVEYAKKFAALENN